MLKDQLILRIPGPTPIPPSVNRALLQPMVGHRDRQVSERIKKLIPRLRPLFGTEKNDVLIVAGSGTSGLEAAAVNLTQEGEEVLVLVTGAFGDRFRKILEAYRLTVHAVETEWGEPVDPEQVKKALNSHPGVKVVFATHSETSTGVLNPIDQIAHVVHEHSDALIAVDGVSSIGGAEMRMDEWKIDLVVTGSQKALMLPPGLAFLAVSEKAWTKISNNPRPRFYLDLLKYKKSLGEDTVPFTPAVSHLFALDQSLSLIEEEGLQETLKRHLLMMKMTRAGIRAMGVPLLVAEERYSSPTVTAVIPDDFTPGAFRTVMSKEFNIVFASGQGHLKDRIFRIGHMGYCSPTDVLQYLGAMELALQKVGHEVTLGAGVAAAQEVYKR
ncbi:pyridoxal-phosphate-dependent aminotransferase family protein [Thermicanus aegyptius]|uniref:pyridoxal-phosphate-dependent aminotransferase family protein n=1 Tax=Thermicanus aegyptius TaxID=94009 RepID=UPI0004002771|nr:alanine--glyoxylate aminotransferase family protein [Thermicanus aegyptius]